MKRQRPPEDIGFVASIIGVLVGFLGFKIISEIRDVYIHYLEGWSDGYAQGFEHAVLLLTKDKRKQKRLLKKGGVKTKEARK